MNSKIYGDLKMSELLDEVVTEEGGFGQHEISVDAMIAGGWFSFEADTYD